ncbi:MAG: hypothetical protein AB7E47_17535 [Desulfovibrionaceae bacterium]
MTQERDEKGGCEAATPTTGTLSDLVAVLAPGLDPGRLPQGGPACLRVLDPGLGGRLPAAERAALFVPPNLPMPPDTSRRYLRDMQQWVDTVRKPGDLLHLVGAAEDQKQGLRGEMAVLERFQRDQGAPPVVKDAPGAPGTPGMEDEGRTKAQMVCILARALEERLAEMHALTTRFGDILGGLKATLGVESSGGDVPEEDHFLSSGIVEHLDGGAGTPDPVLPWRMVVASMLALLDPAVPLFCHDAALAEVWRDAGVAFGAVSPAEAAKALGGWTPPDGVLERIVAPGSLLVGRRGDTTDKPWLDAPRTLYVWSRA